MGQTAKSDLRTVLQIIHIANTHILTRQSLLKKLFPVLPLI